MLGADNARESSPEQKLYAAVLFHAVRDLFATPASEKAVSSELPRAEALAFLTDVSGQWSQSREIICGIVGFDPGMLCRTIIDILDGRRQPPEISARHRPFTGLSAAQKLWMARRETVSRMDTAARAREDGKLRAAQLFQDVPRIAA